MPRKYTHEEYVALVDAKHHGNIRVTSDYIDSKHPINAYCVLCDYHWTTRADSLFKSRCPLCANKAKTKTHDAFIRECAQIHPDILIKSNYINVRTMVSCECKICHYEWRSLPANLISHGNGCPKCHNVIKRTHEQFVNEMSSITDNIQFISQYAGVDNYIDCKCSLCGFIWSARAGHLLEGIGCPNCRKSKGEEVITHFLQQNAIDFVPQKRYDDLLGVGGRKLSYDFYLPNYNLLIEYQGKQHEEAIDWFGGQKRFDIQQEHDKRKYNYAHLHNIEFLVLWYYDYNNIVTILQNKLNALQLCNASQG